MIRELSEINSFFNTKNKDELFEYHDLVYIFVKEFHWTINDFEESEIPAIYAIMDKHKIFIDKQNKDMRKRR